MRSSATNITVYQGAVNLAFTSVPDVSNQVVVSIQGTIDTSGYSVWVNGVKATVSGSAPNIAWEADNVPVNGMGTTVFEALAISNGDHGGNGTPGTGCGGTNSTLTNPGNPVPAVTSPVLQTAPDTLPAIICTSYSATIDTLWTDALCHTNDVFLNEVWSLKAPGFASSSTFANYDNNANGYNGDLDAEYGFAAGYQVWDPFGIGSSNNYVSLTDNDFTHPTNYPSTMDMTGQGFTAEESDYSTTSFGWTDDDFPENATIYGPAAAQLAKNRKVASSYILRTGGKAASHRQAVFELNVTAQEMMHTGNPTPTPVRVPCGRITVMGRPLGSDNLYYVAEPDGVDLTLPVVVSGSQSFTFNVAPTKHHFVLFANGSLLMPDKVMPQAHFCVGQHVTFTQSFIPALPSATQFAPIQWVLGGTCVNCHIPQSSEDDSGTGSGHYEKSQLLLTLPSASAWWIDGGNNPPSTYGARLGEGLIMPNGQYVAITTRGEFTIYRPLVYSNSFNRSAASFAVTNGYLRIGHSDGTGQMQFSVSMTSQFSGQAGWTQLIDGTAFGGPGWQSTEGMELDNAPFPHGFDRITGNLQGALSQIGWNDGPSVPYPYVTFFTQEVSMAYSFKTYLRFIPDGDDSIPITLGIVTWGANGSAGLTYRWLLDPGSFVTIPVYIDSIELPTWPATLYNGTGL